MKDLNANLATLTAQFEKATAEKIKCQQEADATNRVITLANRYRADGSPCAATRTEPGSSLPRAKNPRSRAGPGTAGGGAVGPGVGSPCPSQQMRGQPGLAHTVLNVRRLIGGLASENVRWAESVETFREQEKTLCGDVLLICAFVSYVGYFTKKYRAELMEKCWVPYLQGLKVCGSESPGVAPAQRGSRCSRLGPQCPLSFRCPFPPRQSWTPSASSPTPPTWPRGATRGCPATAPPPRTLPSSATRSGGHWWWTLSCRASSGSGTNTGSG